MCGTVEYVTDRTLVTVDEVLAVFAHGAWTRGRTREQVTRMLAATDTLVLARQDGRPVGFARVVSDNVFRGFVEDVIVEPALQGEGVGRQMMELLEARIAALGISRLELTTQRTEFWHKLGYVEKPTTTYLFKPLAQLP